MKSKILMLLFVLSAVAFSSKVSAESTGVLSGPSLTPGSTYNTSQYILDTSYSTVKGSNTAVIFSGLGTLATRYASDNSRILSAKLYEYDLYPNADDLVKTYTGKFVGRNLNNVVLSSVNDSGNIDSQGDKTAELYMSFLLKKNAADASTATNRFFYYNVYMN